MPDRRPKVFISSTIYDFRDLRSALKYWLEELGYDVLLSEHNDFPVQADLNSYVACLEAIDDCDYFILLVGSRVGGLFDAANQVSITQAEYRRAYDRLAAGTLKLASFVRQELWDVREDRRELERLLTNDALRIAELPSGEIDKITTHRSKFANDAAFTFAFLNEIARNDEMRAAVIGDGRLPVGNWIRQFKEFRDIIDALKVEFRIGANLLRTALLANLKAEITSNFQVLSHMNGDTVHPTYQWGCCARQSLHGSIDGSSDFDGQHLKWLGIFAAIGCGLGRNLSTSALEEAITSGEFLDFDRQANAFVVGPMQDSLLLLKRSIDRLRWNEELMDPNSRTKMAREFAPLDANRQLTIRNLQLIPILSIHDSQSNVVALSRAIYKAADGDYSELATVQLFGDSPLDEENETMQRERPTKEQIERWLGE